MFVPVLEIFSVPDSNLLVPRQVERPSKVSEDDLLRVGVANEGMPVPKTCVPNDEKKERISFN